MTLENAGIDFLRVFRKRFEDLMGTDPTPKEIEAWETFREQVEGLGEPDTYALLRGGPTDGVYVPINALDTEFLKVSNYGGGHNLYERTNEFINDRRVYIYQGTE